MTTYTLSGPGTAVRRVGLARQHDFRSLWLGETTSSLGSSVTSLALPLVALTVLHAGVVAVGVLSAAAWLPWLVVGLPAGAWVDRLLRRPVMMACDAGSLVLFVSVPVAVWFDVLTMAQLVLVALLAGVAKVFFSTAYRAYLPALVPETDLVEANARLQGSESATQVVGPGIAGVLAQVAGAAGALLLDAASFAVSLVCLRRIDAVETRTVTARKPLRREIGDGLRFVARDPLLRVTTVFGCACNLVLAGYSAIQVTYLVRVVGVSAGLAGLLVAVGSAGGVVGAVAAPVLVRRLGSARALLVTKLGAPVFGLLIPLTDGGWRLVFFGLGSFGMVGGIVAGNVVMGGFMQAYCPRPMMGRITTSIQVINFGAIPLGAVAAGLLAQHAGFGPTLWILFVGFAAAATILLAAPIRHRRDLPTRGAVLS